MHKRTESPPSATSSAIGRETRWRAVLLWLAVVAIGTASAQRQIGEGVAAYAIEHTYTCQGAGNGQFDDTETQYGPVFVGEWLKFTLINCGEWVAFVNPSTADNNFTMLGTWDMYLNGPQFATVTAGRTSDTMAIPQTAVVEVQMKSTGGAGPGGSIWPRFSFKWSFNGEDQYDRIAFRAVAPPPPAPTNLAATAGDGSITLSFTRPVTSLTITGYQYSFDGTNWATASVVTPNTATSFTITQTPFGQALQNGTTYNTLQIRAFTSSLTGAASGLFPAVTLIPPVPVPPTVVLAAGPGVGEVTATVAPGVGGGAPASYVVSLSDTDTCSVSTGSGGTCTISGLTPGAQVSATAVAENLGGTSPTSTPSSLVTVLGVPNTPQGLSGSADAGSVTFAWTPFANGSADAGYGTAVYESRRTLPAPATEWTAATSPVAVSGLTNGTAYTFEVRAKNEVATGGAASVTLTPRSVPDAPASVTLTPGYGTLAVEWAAPPSDGGAALTSYRIQYRAASSVTYIAGTGSCQSDLSVATSSCILSDLSDGTSYEVEVVAVNAVGVGPGASASMETAGKLAVVAPSSATDVEAGVSFAVTVELQNETAPVLAEGVTVSVQLVDGGATVLHGLQSSVTNASGRVVFSGLSLAGAAAPSGTDYTLRFSAAGLTPVDHLVVLTPGAPTALVFDAIPTEQLRNIPFELSVRLQDAFGNVTVARSSVSVTLSASGGVDPDGVLRTSAFPLPAVDPEATITVGESVVAFPGLVYTGLSAENGSDVDLTGAASGLASATRQGLTFGDISLEIASEKPYIRADGASSTAITLTLRSAQGPAIADATITFVATAGSFGVSGLETTATTDSQGKATATLTSDVTVGVVTVTGHCPGDCPVSTSVVFGMEPSAPTIESVIAGDESTDLVLAFTPGFDGALELVNYEVSSDGGSTFVAFSPALTTSPVTVSGLVPNTSYSLMLRAVNALGSGSPSTASSAVATRPGAPTGLTVAPVSLTDGVAEDGTVTITWSLPIGGAVPITAHAVSVTSSVAGAAPVACEPTPASALSCSFVAPKGSLGVEYNVSVTASNASGGGAAATTVATFVRVPYAPVITAVAAGVAPTELSVVFSAPVSDGGAEITNYAVSTDGGASFLLVDPPQTTSPISVSGLIPNTSYAIVLRAVNVLGGGADASSLTGVTLPAAPNWAANPVALIFEPSPVVGESTSDGSLRLAWEAPLGGAEQITAYRVFARTVAGEGSDPICTVQGGDASGSAASTCVVSASDLALGADYEFRVAASNASGEGPLSAWSDPPFKAIRRSSVPFAVQASLTSVVGDVRVTWAASEADGADPISAYVVLATSRGGGVTRTCTLATTASPELACIVQGLSVETPWVNPEAPVEASTLDATYDFFVFARNGAGLSLGQSTSEPSNPPAWLIVQGTPNPPAFVSPAAEGRLFANDASAFVAFVQGEPRGLPVVRFEFELRDAAGVVVPWGDVVDEFGGVLSPSGSDLMVGLVPGVLEYPNVAASPLVNGAAYSLWMRAVNSVPLRSEEVLVGEFVPQAVPSRPLGVGESSLVSVLGGERMLVSWTPPARNGAEELTYRVSVFRADTDGANDPFDVAREVVTTCVVASPISRCLLTGTDVSPSDFGPGAYDVVVAAALLSSGTPPVFGRAVDSVRVDIPVDPLVLPEAPGVPVFGYVDGEFERATVTWLPVLDERTGGSEILYYERALHASGDATTSLASCFVNVARVGNSPEPLPFVAAEAATVLSCAATGLARGSAYMARSRARTLAGWGPWSDFSEPFVAAVLPGEPTLLAAQPGSRSVNLAFEAPSDDGGAAVEAYEFSIDAGASWNAFEPLVARDDVPAVIEGLVNGVTYSVRLRARNAVGEGPASNELSFVPRAGDVGVPASFSAVAGNAKGWLLFELSPAALAVDVSVNEQDWSRIGVAELRMPYLLAGLENDTEYCVRIREVGESGPGAVAEAACMTPSEAAALAPDMDLSVDAAEGPIEVAVTDGFGELTFDFLLHNTGDIALPNVWLRPLGIPERATLLHIAPTDGRGTITPYPGIWYWEGVNLEVAGTATIRIIVRLEVEP